MNLQEHIRKVLQEESLKKTLMDEIERSGIRDTASLMSVSIEELLDMVGIRGTKDNMIFLTKSIMENEVKERLKYCSYQIVPTLHSFKLYVFIPKPLPENEGNWYHDKWLRQEAEDIIRHFLYDLGGGLIRGHNIHVSNTGNC